MWTVKNENITIHKKENQQHLKKKHNLTLQFDYPYTVIAHYTTAFTKLYINSQQQTVFSYQSCMLKL
jgi:hypothetical protein